MGSTHKSVSYTHLDVYKRQGLERAQFEKGMEELSAGQTGLELHWLLLVAVLISSLGAVMDVALSLASSLHELREACLLYTSRCV